MKLLSIVLIVLLSFNLGSSLLFQQQHSVQQQQQQHYQVLQRIQRVQPNERNPSLRHHRHQRINNSPSALASSSSSSSSKSTDDDYRDFDFSSKIGWNQFYQASSKNEIITTEWHNSIDLEQLVQRYVMTYPTMNMNMTMTPKSTTKTTTTTTTTTNAPSSTLNCLLVGCGNSRLARVIMDTMKSNNNGNNNNDNSGTWTTTRISCLDSSATCLEQLKQQFHPNEYDDSHHDNNNNNNKIVFICGDAVELRKSLGWKKDNNHVHDDTMTSQQTRTEAAADYNKDDNDCNNIMDHHDNVPPSSSSCFDIIIDKGLMDALLCGEGWNGPVERLLHESMSCLKSPGGTYLLISYRLPSSTMEFLTQVTSPHFEWDFQRPESNARVQVSLATKVQ